MKKKKNLLLTVIILFLILVSLIIYRGTVALQSEDVYDVILFWGQSNMLGAAGAYQNEKNVDSRVENDLQHYAAITDIDIEIVSKYTAMNHVDVNIDPGTVYEFLYSGNNKLVEINSATKTLGENLTYDIQNNSISSNSVSPYTLQKSYGTNMAPQFAKTYYEKTGHKVIIVLAAKGGQEIANFLPHDEVLALSHSSDENKNLYIYEAMIEKYNAAIEYLSSNNMTIGNKFYVSFQGEADAVLATSGVQDANTYVNAYKSLHDHLKNDCGLSFGVLVETANIIGTNNVGINEIHKAQVDLINKYDDIILGSSYAFRKYIPAQQYYTGRQAFSDAVTLAKFSICDADDNHANKLNFTSASLSQIGLESALNVADYVLENENIIDYNSNDITLGTFFTANYLVDNAGNASDTDVDQRVGLYVTSNGSDYKYLGDTGIIGRDSRILYKNGIFYLATTKGGSVKGGYTFNLFKSTDLFNWTYDTAYPYDYRYEVGMVENNKYGLSTNTWGPKWVETANGVYMIVYSTRFDTDGSKYYFLKKDSLNANNVEYDASLYVEASNIGVLVREYAVLDENNRAQYQYTDSNGSTITYYTRDDTGIYNTSGVLLEEVAGQNGVYRDTTNNCTLDTKYGSGPKQQCGKTSRILEILTNKQVVVKNGKFVQVNCPWYSYPIFDAFISKVNFGNTGNINSQDLTFDGFSKMQFVGVNVDLAGDELVINNVENNDNSDSLLYYYGHSYLPMIIYENLNSPKYKYALYLKVDPFGSIQRWLAESIDGPWYQIDDRFYPASYEQNNGIYVSNSLVHSNAIICNSLDDNSLHPDRVSGALEIDNINEDIAYARHYEGTFINTFNNQLYYYSDHYDAKKEFMDDNMSSRNKHYGIYYSKIDNSDLTISTDHVRFNTFVKVNTFNTMLRPNNIISVNDTNGELLYDYNNTIYNNVIRNGDVYRPKEDMEAFVKVLKNANKFHLSYKVYDGTTDDKYLIVIKANRGILQNSSMTQYYDDFRLVTPVELKYNSKLKSIFSKYDDTIPYTAMDLYLYKEVDKDSIVNLTVYDNKENAKKISFKASLDNSQFITYISENTSINDLNLGLDDSYTVKIIDSNNIEKISGNFGTGDIIQLYLNNQKMTEYMVIVSGDVNGDGFSSLLDAQALAKYIIDMENWHQEFFIAGDINQDNKIKMDDALKIIERNDSN